MMRLLLATVLIVTTSSAAAEPLSREEWEREALFMLVGVVDYGQTRDIKNHPELEEKNPLLGNHPSDARIRNYFLAAGAAHLGVTYLLPRGYRPYWQWGTLALLLGVVAHNHSIGLRLDF